MTAAQKLAAFAVAIAAALGLGFGVGRAVGPLGKPAAPAPMHGHPAEVGR